MATQVIRATTAKAGASDGRTTFAVRMLIFFLILEYVRPPVLPELKLQLGIVVLVIVLWLSARNRPWSGILTAQVLFLAVCLQAIPFAWNNFAAYITARTIFGYLGIALGLSWLLATPTTFRKVAWAWLLIMGYVAMYGILHGGKGPGAMLGDENDLALGCATAFPLAFYGFERLSGRRRWLCAGIGALLVIAIVLSFSRGGFVALVVVGVYCWIASRHKLRALLVVVVATLILIVAAPDAGRTGESYVDRIKSMFDTEAGTAEGRRFLWAAARNMWRAHPILGVGGGNFSFLVGQYQPADFEKAEYFDRDWSGTVTHSVYFQVLAEHGSVGALLMAYIVIAHLLTIRRVRRLARSHPNLPAEVSRDADLYGGALGGAMVGYCAAGAFLSVAYYPYLWYFSAMAVALEAAVQREVTAIGVGNA
jgi:putative inorganic carbon (HCO3(-)) transporter